MSNFIPYDSLMTCPQFWSMLFIRQVVSLVGQSQAVILDLSKCVTDSFRQPAFSNVSSLVQYIHIFLKQIVARFY